MAVQHHEVIEAAASALAAESEAEIEDEAVVDDEAHDAAATRAKRKNGSQ